MDNNPLSCTLRGVGSTSRGPGRAEIKALYPLAFHLTPYTFFLSPAFISPFRIFSRGIVLPSRTTTGPTSEFEKPFSLKHLTTPKIFYQFSPPQPANLIHQLLSI